MAQELLSVLSYEKMPDRFCCRGTQRICRTFLDYSAEVLENLYILHIAIVYCIQRICNERVRSMTVQQETYQLISKMLDESVKHLVE